MKTRRGQAELYAESTDKLGIGRSSVVGASEGGLIGSNCAIHKLERVEKLALLGPMGYAGTTQTIMGITFAQFFPLPIVHRPTFRWAFGDDPTVKEAFLDWFSLLMKATYHQKVPPVVLPADLRQSLNVPVMFVFGSRDRPVGDPATARPSSGRRIRKKPIRISVGEDKRTPARWRRPGYESQRSNGPISSTSGSGWSRRWAILAPCSGR